ncbi:hypothetical protein F2P79_001642 [Pimephales promelas]|nr:hypothetical protein F2P79_001642 [Pimephales promelas]
MNALLMLSFFLLFQFICRVGAGDLQQKISLTKAEEKLAIIDCHYTSSDCRYYIHWYQQKEGEPLKRILYVDIDDGSAQNDAGFESIKSEKKTSNHFALKITKLKKEHSAMYYCACWIWSGSDKKVFGSGTRLYVTDQGKDTTKSPTLTAYLPTTKESGKQTRICQATDMFPDLVKFNWKKKSNTGDWTDVSEDNVVEQRNVDPVIVTSILIVDQYTAGEDLYQCTLTYEGGMKQKTLQNDKDPANNNEGATVKPTCSPDNKTSTIQISGSSDQIPSLYLFVYAYGVMLMKNGVYFCAVLIVLLKRKVGNKKESA